MTEVTNLGNGQGFEYTLGSELTALKRRARMIDKTRMIGNGCSPELADMLLDRHDAVIAKAVEKIFMEGSTGTSPLMELMK